MKRKRLDFRIQACSLYLNDLTQLQCRLRDQKIHDKIRYWQELSNSANVIPCYLFWERQICTPQAVQSGSKPQTPRKTTSLSVPQSPSQFAMQALSQSCCLTALSQHFCCELPPGTQQLLEETRGLPPAFPSPRLPSVLSYSSTEMQRCLEILFMWGDTGDSLHLRDAPQGTHSATHGASVPLHIGESVFPNSSLAKFLSMLWKDVFCLNV